MRLVDTFKIMAIAGCVVASCFASFSQYVINREEAGQHIENRSEPRGNKKEKKAKAPRKPMQSDRRGDFNSPSAGNEQYEVVDHKNMPRRPKEFRNGHSDEPEVTYDIIGFYLTANELYDRGEFQDAFDIYQRIDSIGNYAPLGKEEAMCRKRYAKLLYDFGKFDRVLPQLTAVVNLKPKKFNVFRELGDLYSNSEFSGRNLFLAADNYNKGMKKKDPDCMVKLGLLYADANAECYDPKKAEKTLKKASDFFKKNNLKFPVEAHNALIRVKNINSK